MRSFSLLCFYLFLCYFVSPALTAQADAGNPAGATDKDLTTQFEGMVDKSNRYQRFRVVPIEWLNAFKTNLSDSLAASSERTDNLQREIVSSEQEASGQQTEIEGLNNVIVDLKEEKDGISFFGSIISKTAYNLVVWSLIAALLAGMLFFIARSRYAVSVTRDLEERNAELTADLDKSKRRRLEVEQDLGRKLQDEINKHRKA